MREFLVVDDSPTVRASVRLAIMASLGEGVLVREASNLPEALALFERHRPMAVFLDMMFEDRAWGIETLQAIFAREPTARIVLVTALNASHPLVMKALAAGAFAHLVKPVRVLAVKRILDLLEEESGRLSRIR